MWAIFKKEITSFFASPIAYLIIGLFLILCGLFLWVFQGPYNIFDYGFADMSNFFLLAPWIFLFIIPAISMRTFSEERKLGTLELLYIKPQGLWQIVLGKFSATVCLSLLALLPTLLYGYSISELGTTIGNLDTGLVIGSYIGLIFLLMAFASIGVYSSSITDNQIVAFIIALAFCFVVYFISEGLATVVEGGASSLFVKNIGLNARFESMARGVIDSRDIVYFLSISFFFLYLTVVQLKYRRR